MSNVDHEALRGLVRGIKIIFWNAALLGVLWTLGGALAVAAINFSAKFFASNRSPSNDDESGHATKDVECPEGAYDGPQYGALSP